AGLDLSARRRSGRIPRPEQQVMSAPGRRSATPTPSDRPRITALIWARLAPTELPRGFPRCPDCAAPASSPFWRLLSWDARSAGPAASPSRGAPGWEPGHSRLGIAATRTTPASATAPLRPGLLTPLASATAPPRRRGLTTPALATALRPTTCATV